MPSARTSAGAGTGALTSVFVVLGALPAGAVTGQGAGLSPGCFGYDDGTVVCIYGRPSAGPITVDVPAGVISARITVRGGHGGKGQVEFPVFGTSTAPGGPAGSASATVPLDPAKNLEVRVGGAGASGPQGGAGGVNGGGQGSVGTFAGVMTVRGGGGGGGSEVRIAGTDPATENPLIAAGGGGGGGCGFPGPAVLPFFAGPGGVGGGINGGPGAGAKVGDGQSIFGGGYGGSQTGAGLGGALVPGVPSPVVANGSKGAGGNAAAEMPGLGAGGAGGGGGGYYGGGGGSAFSGGGGGSGFGPPGTRYGSGPNTPTGFGAASPADGEVIIVFAPPGKHIAD
jgi:hypothetical protein